jgi:hypothetical protein
MNDYLTDADLAERLGATEAQVVKLRQRYGWPHLKFGRRIRYTEADVKRIEAMHHVEAEKATGLPGQTALSAARSR